MVITIDGPAGAGKSTVARAVAARLGLRYLDTGAMYRALTLVALERDIPLDDEGVLASLAPLAAGRSDDPGLRTPDVDAAVSTVAAHPAVRAAMREAQRAFLAEDGAVAEGRDIGAVVWPDAGLKIWLDPAADVRARRRVDERADGSAAAALHERDRSDAEQTQRAPDAIRIDTGPLGIDEVVDQIVALALERSAPRP